eukprot:m.828758 g.828758  ORF g.828758 m.828758 type:complete len:479 (-) comp23421_c0_seq10:242-1678(-)
MSKSKDRMSRYSSQQSKIEGMKRNREPEPEPPVRDNEEVFSSAILYAPTSIKSIAMKIQDTHAAISADCSVSDHKGVCLETLVPSAARERGYFHTYDLGVVELSQDLRMELESFIDRRQTFPFSLLGEPSQDDVRLKPIADNPIAPAAQTLFTRVRSGKASYMCTTCGQRFIQKGQLYDHELLHLSKVDRRQDQDLVCTYPQCGRKFTKPSHLERHSRLHLDIKDLNALSASDQATQAAAALLVKHGMPGSGVYVKSAPDALPIVDVVGMVSVTPVLESLQRSSLLENPHDLATRPKNQGMNHTPYSDKSKSKATKKKKPNRVFKCEYCDKCFSQSGNLSRHRVIHMKIRPFKCEECGKGFTQKSHLKTHCNVHTGLKKFQCQICDKRFSQLGHLKTHVGIHKRAALEQRSISCNQCGKTFIQTCDRDKHVEMVHRPRIDTTAQPQQSDQSSVAEEQNIESASAFRTSLQVKHGTTVL